MQESAQAAHSWVRTHAAELGIDPNWFGEHDVHVHVPAGAVPKDGPSAGITMATALVSLSTGKPVSDDVAMTGEITLTGQVLPIGGIKEKVLAAHRAGIAKVIFPKENESDLEELPPETREELSSSRWTGSTRCSRSRSKARCRRSLPRARSHRSARPPLPASGLWAIGAG